MIGALMWWLKGRESSLSFDKDLDVGPEDGGESLHLGCLLVIGDITFLRQRHTLDIDKCVVYYKIRMLYSWRLKKCLGCVGGL